LHVSGHIDEPREVIQGHPIFEEFLVIRQLSKGDFSPTGLLPHDMLFTLSELEESPRIVLSNFFSNYDRLRPALDLYMSTLYHPDQLVRLRFLTLAQSAEAYPRVSMPGKYMDDEQYNNGLGKLLWDTIPHEIATSFRAALKNKLKYLNEYSLRKRIEILAREHAEIIGKLLGSPAEFADSVSELRNKLTHPEPSSDALGKTEWKELWHLSEKLALLMEACFLTEFGFGKDRIRDIMQTRSERARRVHFGVL
jgi:Apea-like HEPN